MRETNKKKGSGLRRAREEKKKKRIGKESGRVELMEPRGGRGDTVAYRAGKQVPYRHRPPDEHRSGNHHTVRTPQ